MGGKRQEEEVGGREELGCLEQGFNWDFHGEVMTGKGEQVRIRCFEKFFVGFEYRDDLCCPWMFKAEKYCLLEFVGQRKEVWIS